MNLKEARDTRKRGALLKDTHFWNIYESQLYGFQDKDIKLLEIGVYNGGSLWTWRNYFPNADIVGIDIDDYACQWASQEDRIRIYQGDQADPIFLKSVIAEEKEFDIIIDDGGHESHQVITSFKHLFPVLQNGGLYIVEDTGHSFWPDYDCDRDTNTSKTIALNPIKKKSQTTMNFFKGLTDKVTSWAYLNNVEAGKNKKARCPDYYEDNIFSINFFDNVLVIQKCKRPRSGKCFGQTVWYGHNREVEIKN